MVDKKGFGKEYNPDDFSKPATEAEGSKKHLWIGAAVIALLVVGAGIFFFGGGDSGVSVTGATISAYCVDSDGGYNRFTQGITAGTYYLDYDESEFTDKCAGDENKLTEYYCKNDLIVYTTEPCPEGMLCSNGICTT
jgi:hypothetical protein